ncbi:hypothetical protein PPM_p0193 (plasmid) [Paenibacillus polymyxa M1]|nr:hypothetical protein PPM_p0193 [Paenibacillus polymyxa M1]
MNNMSIYKKAQNGKAILTIEYDSDAMCPRFESEHLGSMVFWHGRYNLGDKHRYKDGNDFFITLLKEMGRTEKTLCRVDSRKNLFEVLEKHYVILPVYLYDHGSLTISTTPFQCPWDSGQIGWIYVSNKKIREEYNVKRVSKKLRFQVLSHLQLEVEIYDHYLRGDVYSFILKDLDGEIIDSGDGFYGSNPHTNGIAECISSEYEDLIKEIA